MIQLEQNWLVKNHVLMQKVSGVLTIEDINNWIQTNEMVMEPVISPDIFAIVDIRQMACGSYNLLTLFNEVQPAFAHFKMKEIVLVSDKKENVLHLLIAMITQVFGIKFRVFPDVYQSWKYLQSVDSSLIELTVDF